jgi:hypothetical protein
MEYTPERFVAEHKEMGQKVDWDLYESNRKLINQWYADTNDWNGLDQFYSTCVELIIKDSLKEKVLSLSFDEFRTELLSVLNKANEKAKSDKKIKAIYYEYNSDITNFFLCDRFEEKELTDWPCEFEIDGMFNGPSIEETNFHYDLELENYEQEVIRRYFDAKITSSLGRVLENFERELPIAMSEHDYEILYYRK